jgi:hypothetical protein
MRKLFCILFIVYSGLHFNSVAHSQGTTSRPRSGVVTGIVYAVDTGEPIPFVTVQALETGRSTLTNEDGRFRILLPAGSYQLKLSHIGYYSEQTTLDVDDSTTTRDFRLRPSLIELKGIRVYKEAYDPGQQIIIEAIKRKNDILSRLHDYSYDAYSKLVIRDESKTDSSEIFMIAESQTTAYWEQPDKYKEVLSARKQSSNLASGDVILVMGEILNFNKNRIDIGEYSVVTPTAKDALDSYDYYLLDTVLIDSRRVFVLEIEPKSQAEPLFVGTIHIADSTYDVVMVDVGFNEAFRPPMMDSIRYSQRFAQFNDEFWMPIEIRLWCLLQFKVPFPGVPSRLSLDWQASLYSFSFEKGHAEGTFDEYAFIVDENADDFDTLAWSQRQTIPLTEEEVRGYERIDSIANAPKPLGKKIALGLAGALALMMFGDDDIFHFNRVEGPYLGAGVDLDRIMWETDLWLSGGYAFDAKDWSFRIGLSREIWKQKKLWLGAEAKNRVVHRPTIFARPGFNSTTGALWYASDPYDYYREKGYRLMGGFRPVDHTRIRLTYRDYRQTTADLVTDYSFFGDSGSTRVNPAIADGHLRSIETRFRYDSRSRMLSKGTEYMVITGQYTMLELGVEYASPDVIDNDFDFTRYYARLHRQQHSLGLGLTSIELYWGDADGNLPPQNQFTVDHSDPVFFRQLGFKTLNEHNYSGNEVLSAYANHNFGMRLFRKSGFPLLKELPFDVGIHGGAFWSDFDGGRAWPQNGSPRTALTAFGEVGFSLSNLTPFISPFNLATSFTWQLSDYDTARFAWQIGLRL